MKFLKRIEKMEQKKAIRTKDGFRVTHINRRRACRFMCIECMGWGEANREVDACNGEMLDGTICALIDFKDMRAPQNAAKRSKATRLFCRECMGGNSALVADCSSVYCPVFPYRLTKADKSVLFDIDIADDIVLETTKRRAEVRADMFLNRPQESF